MFDLILLDSWTLRFPTSFICNIIAVYVEIVNKLNFLIEYFCNIMFSIGSLHRKLEL